MSFKIVGTGAAHPRYVLENSELTSMVDTSDEWITSRTGIKSRYISTDETLTDIAAAAAERAMRAAGVGPGELDLIICSTVQGDYATPSLACMVQRELGASCPAMDVNAACTGFIYSLDIAAAYLETGRAETVLVVSAEMMSKHVDWEDRATCVLFGDGAGAVVLKPGSGMLAMRIGARGDEGPLNIPALGTRSPFTTLPEVKPRLSMSGSEVYKFAVTCMQEDIRAVLGEAGLSVSDITLLLPHQANVRIISSVLKGLSLPADKAAINIDRYGNTSSASIPILLSEVIAEGRLRESDIAVLAAMGGGLTSGACVIRI